MKHIPLGADLFSVVDDQDFELLAAHRWHVKRTHSGHMYAVRNNPRGVSPRVIKMHRTILEAPADILVDHWNGDGLDNRRENLRFATVSQNGANRRVVLNQHGYKGVFRVPYSQNKGRRWQRRKQWKATLVVDKRAVSLGYYLSPEEAADAYDCGAVRYFGEFAATNHSMGLR